MYDDVYLHYIVYLYTHAIGMEKMINYLIDFFNRLRRRRLRLMYL